MFLKCTTAKYTEVGKLRKTTGQTTALRHVACETNITRNIQIDGGLIKIVPAGCFDRGPAFDSSVHVRKTCCMTSAVDIKLSELTLAGFITLCRSFDSSIHAVGV